jgi:hypothetical protein
MLVNFNGRDCHVVEVGTDENGTMVNGSPLFGVVYLLDDDGKDHIGDFHFAYRIPVAKVPSPSAAKPAHLPPGVVPAGPPSVEVK